MIRYQLQCDKDHGFEAWFSNSTAYETQVKRNLVVCPKCGSTKISKSVMAPNIGIKTNRKVARNTPQDAPSRDVTVAQKAAAMPAGDPASSEAHREILTALRKMREIVEKNSEYVGPRFAEEARKIHYGETEKRDIYGQADGEEIVELQEEGVEFNVLPWMEQAEN